MLIIISSSVTTFALEINYLKVSHHSCVVCSRESSKCIFVYLPRTFIFPSSFRELMSLGKNQTIQNWGNCRLFLVTLISDTKIFIQVHFE